MSITVAFLGGKYAQVIKPGVRVAENVRTVTLDGVDIAERALVRRG